MTGQEMLQAVKPFAAAGAALVRIEAIAREATRLESEFGAVTTRIATTRAALAAAETKHGEVEAACRALQLDTDAACAALLADAKVQAHDIVDAAKAEGAKLRADHAEWRQKIEALKRDHDARAEALKAQSQSLQDQVEALKADARRLVAAAQKVA